MPRLRQELEALRIRSGRLKAEGRDLAEYRIVGDSDTDPSIKWGFDEEGRDGLLEVEEDQHVEVPTGNGQVIRVDLRKEGGHTDWVFGARLLPDGSILSWSDDHTLIVWQKRGTEYVQVQRLGEPGNEKDPSLGHLGAVEGARLLPDGSILSWSDDHTLIVWQKRGTEYVQVQRLGEPRNEEDRSLGHLNWVYGAQLLPDGTVRSLDSTGRVLWWRLSVPQAIADELAKLEKEIGDLEARLAAAEASR